MSQNDEIFHRFKSSDLIRVMHKTLNETSVFRYEKTRADGVNLDESKSELPSFRTAALGFTASVILLYAFVFFLSTIA